MADSTSPYYMVKQICSAIRYPCVIFFVLGDKYKVCACRFVDSVKEDKNILKSIYISAWVRDNPSSFVTLQLVKKLSNVLLNGEGSIKELYDSICQYISECPAQFVTTRTFMTKIAHNLVGSDDAALVESIPCYEHYFYEYEDIWYTFMNNEKVRKIIENRRYRDIEDLVYQIDCKLSDLR